LSVFHFRLAEKTMQLLEIEHLTKEFDGVIALQDVSFGVEEREILGVIGPNGAGKTTLFNCITGMIPPTRGTIRYRGESIQDQQPYEIARLGVARTFQLVRPFQTSLADNVWPLAIGTTPHFGAPSPHAAPTPTAPLRRPC
jgi:branched-chain amino acid transport system ATP-binding protein